MLTSTQGVRVGLKPGSVLDAPAITLEHVARAVCGTDTHMVSP